MLLPKVFLLCVFCHQMIHGHTAAGLKALATLHSHRAKALANALNLRARAHYNTAIAKTRASSLGLYDRRFIRDSDDYSVEEEEEDPEFVPDFEEDYPFENIGNNDSGEDIDSHLIHETIFNTAFGEQGTEDFMLQQRDPLQVRNEDFIEGQRSQINLKQEQPAGQQLRGSADQGDLFQIPLGFDNFDGSDKLSMYPIYEDGIMRSATDGQEVQGNNLDGSIVEDNGGCPVCSMMMRSQLGDFVPDDRQMSPEPNVDPQLLFNQEAGGPPPRFMGNEQDGVPSMQIPSSVDFQNLNNAQQFPTMHPILSTLPTTFDQQGFSEEGNNGNGFGEGADERLFEPQVRTQENGALSDVDDTDGTKSTDLIARHRLRPHGHVHTHMHSFFHGIQPLEPNIHIPTTQVISPGVNVHIIQNQNAALGPQFATTSIQPGLNTAVVNPKPVVYDTSHIQPSHFSNLHTGQTGVVPQVTGHGTGISQAQTIQTHSSQIMPSTQQLGHNLGGNIGHVSDVNQFQTVHTHSAPVLPGNQQLFVSPNIGGSTITQTQSVHQGARQGGHVDGAEMAKEDIVPVDFSDLETDPQQIFDDVFLRQNRFGDEKVGTFLDNAPQEAPEFHYDHNQPENRQGIVRYIENEQENIKRFLHIMENNNQYNSDRADYELNNNKPGHLHKTDEFDQTFDNTELHPIYGNSMYDGERDAEQHIPKVNHRNTPGRLDNARLAEANFQNEKVGTINMGYVPESFQKFESDLRHHLETDERGVETILDQTGQNYRRGMDSLSSLIDIDHGPPHNQAHFQNYHNTDPDGHIQVQEVDVPDGDKNERSSKPHHLVDREKGAEEDIKVTRPETLLDRNAEDRLGYIIQVPDRRYSDDYQRQARSLNQTTIAKLDKLLLEEKKLINDLKKDAKHDEDMMMIGYIGDSFINDLENRLNKTRREKREIGRNRYLPLRRLVTDSRAKLDMTKTLENLGAATRHVFEHEKAPLYHVRNMVGSAQDAMLAAMKIPTKNFLIPSAYDIVKTQGDDDVVGAINPALFSRNGGQNLRKDGPIDEIMTTFQRVGSAIRGSVKSGQEALNHVGDVANHAKSALHSTKHATPKLILKDIPAISREPKKKAMLITPRIFDISAEDNQVGSTLGKREPDFVKMGHILDAVGVSKPNYNLEFEKIVIEPRSSFSDFDSSEEPKIKRPMSLKDLLENIKIEKIKNANDVDVVGNTLNTLNDARSTVGAHNLQDFIVQMRHKFKKMLNATQANKKAKNWKPIDKSTQKIDQSEVPHQTKYHTSMTREIHPQNATNNENIEVQIPERQENSLNDTMAENPVELDEESVGMSLLPEEIRHPFLGQATLAQRQEFMRQNTGDTNRRGTASRSHKQFMRENNYEEVGSKQDKYQRQTDRDLGQILGAINPMMFERIFNETLKVNNTNTPHSLFHHHHNGHSHGHHHTEDVSSEENVGTSMTIKGQMLRPFMGQASGKLKQEFFDKYKPEEDAQDNEDEDDCSEEDYEDWPELTQWVDIFHPFHESSGEYDE